MAIEKGNWIKVSYTGTLKDGTVFDSSEGKEPITFEVGAGSVIKGFDDNVAGMTEGDEKEFTIPAADAYGEESDKNQEEVPMDFFKDVEKVEIGMSFMAQSPMGPLKVKVLSTNEADKKATVSVNHPLAGEDLTFKIKVDSIMSEEEAQAFKEAQAKQHEEMMKAQGAGCGCGSGECAPDGNCGDSCGCDSKDESEKELVKESSEEPKKE